MADDKAKKGKAVKSEKTLKRPKPEGEFKPLKVKDFTVSRKRSGRFEVVNAKGKNVNGADKVKVLVEAKLIKDTSKPSAKKAEAAAPATPAAT